MNCSIFKLPYLVSIAETISVCQRNAAAFDKVVIHKKDSATWFYMAINCINKMNKFLLWYVTPNCSPIVPNNPLCLFKNNDCCIEANKKLTACTSALLSPIRCMRFVHIVSTRLIILNVHLNLLSQYA